MSARFLRLRNLLLPIPDFQYYKGCCGKVGVISGSIEYTGSAVFACKAALKTGADLVHLFCLTDTAIPLKTLLPEVIVHQAPTWIDHAHNLPWDRMDAFLMGCGMGRTDDAKEALVEIVKEADRRGASLILDGDALFYWQALTLLPKMNNIRLWITPNHMELTRMQAHPESPFSKFVRIEKGPNDAIITTHERVVVTTKGNAKRCGGLGDVLVGILVSLVAAAVAAPRRSLTVTEAELDNCMIDAAVWACEIARRAGHSPHGESRAFSAFDLIGGITEQTQEEKLAEWN